MRQCRRRYRLDAIALTSSKADVAYEVTHNGEVVLASMCTPEVLMSCNGTIPLQWMIDTDASFHVLPRRERCSNVIAECSITSAETCLPCNEFDSEFDLLVSSESIQDGTVRATTILPRRDPLNSLRLYEGGFNVKERHYWSSVAFTGIWAFSMAFVCLAAGIATLLWWFCDRDSGMTSVLPAHSDILRGRHC
ncbi:hypothetical protein L7F22_028393 [Adiantum nelumboides]|nr:hypothetical protein [Adiantum nelumboides]